MKTNLNTDQTAYAPSLGMSAHAASGVATCTGTFASTGEVRLDAIAPKGGFPGVHAWSPPIT